MYVQILTFLYEDFKIGLYLKVQYGYAMRIRHTWLTLYMFSWIILDIIICSKNSRSTSSLDLWHCTVYLLYSETLALKGGMRDKTSQTHHLDIIWWPLLWTAQYRTRLEVHIVWPENLVLETLDIFNEMPKKGTTSLKVVGFYNI